MAFVAVMGLLLLAAAAHYAYTNYYNSKKPQYEYHETYNPPESQWQLPQYEYKYEENSVDIFPNPSISRQFTLEQTTESELASEMIVHTETWIKSTSEEPPLDTTIKSADTSAVNSAPQTLHTISTQPTTDTPHITSRLNDSGIVYTLVAAKDVGIQTLKSNKYYEYKKNSEIQHDPGEEVQFQSVDHVIVRDAAIRRNEINKEEKINKELNNNNRTERLPLPSSASIRNLGYFLEIAAIVIFVLS